MDIAKILEVFNSINHKGNLMESKSPYNCKRCYDTGKTECSWCNGNGYLGGAGFKVKCRHCQDGQETCRCQTDKKEVNESKEIICKECGADGVIPCQSCRGKDGNFKCKDCFGEGELTCPVCKGKGHIMENTNVKSKVNECETVAGTMAQPESNLTVNTSYDSSTNRRTLSITADNEKAEELASILKLAGISTDGMVVSTEPKPSQVGVQELPVVTSQDPYYGLREDISSYDLDEDDLDSGSDMMDEYNKEEWEPTEDNLGYSRHEEESNNGFCVRCNEVPIEGDGFDHSGLCYDCYNAVSSKLEDNYPEPELDDFEEMNRNEADDYRDEFNESKLNEASEYYVEFNSPKGYQYLKMSGRLKNFTKNKSEATKFSDQAEAKSNAASLKSTGKYSEVKVVPVLESRLNESLLTMAAVAVSKIEQWLSKNRDNSIEMSAFKITADNISRKFKVPTWVANLALKKLVHTGELTQQKDGTYKVSYMTSFGPNVNEELTPKRENSGLNGAARGWQNSPNEQIAGWKALIDDADGPNKPKESYPNRLGDNPIKVADNKKDKPLHENKQVNEIAEDLMAKFSKLNESSIDAKAIKNFNCPKCKAKKGQECHTDDGERIVFPHSQRVKLVENKKLNENEAAYAAKQLNFQHLERKLEDAGFIHNTDKEKEIHHSVHIFTRDGEEFISISKDGKWDWAYHANEELSEGEGKSSLLTLVDNLTPSLEEAGYDIPDDYEIRRQKALDFAMNDNVTRGKMYSQMDKEANPFTSAAHRLAKVAPDYKPLGIPMREI